MRLPDLDLRLYVPRPPFWLVALIVLSAVASWVPLALIARHRVTKHDKPRIHIFQGMDNQAKLKAQHPSPVFADGRAMRPRIEGTVARGELAADDHFERGFEITGVVENEDGTTTPDVHYFEGYPDNIDVNDALLKTGQLRYNIHCALCHGESGNGMGTVQQRAQDLITRGNTGTVWTAVANLHQADEDGNLTFGEALYPNGKLYNTIAVGKGAMNGYAAQIKPADRWAIVAYVRALQLTQQSAEGGPVAQATD
ncbi:MAG: c-type cytochrome [Planctomycetes bacterium]|jgi:mono/diheme cytochrome c family protein|nr:c-type cytochrome [Planctomycetota bacterium]